MFFLLVVPEMVLPPEGLLADIALVGPLVSVRPFVDHQVVALRKVALAESEIEVRKEHHICLRICAVCSIKTSISISIWISVELAAELGAPISRGGRHEILSTRYILRHEDQTSSQRINQPDLC